MSEAKWFGNKERAQKPELKPVGPSFEELLFALPPEKRERLRDLKDIPEEIAQFEYGDGSYGIDRSGLDVDSLCIHDEYLSLMSEAKELLDAQPKTTVFGQE